MGISGSHIGEVRKANEAGWKETYKVLWHSCVDCGKERWVRIVKGSPVSLRCISCGVKNVAKYAQDNPLWQGGRYKDPEGYIQLRIHPENVFFPMTNVKRRSIPEHRLIMAQSLKRFLEPWEIVHHINGIKDDNRLENLELLPSQAVHLTILRLQQEIKSLKEQLVSLKKEKDVNYLS